MRAVTIEIQLMKIKKEGFLDEFKNSEEFLKAKGKEGEVLRKVVLEHDWKKGGEADYMVGFKMEEEICHVVRTPMINPDEKKLNPFADEIIEIINSFMDKHPKLHIRKLIKEAWERKIAEEKREASQDI